MNLVNRVLVLLLIVGGLALAGAFIYLVWAEGKDLHVGDAEAVRVVFDVDAGGSARYAATAVAGGIAAVLALLLVLEVRPRRGRQLRLRPAGGDAVYVPYETLVQRVEEDARRVPHVEEVRARVEAKGKGVAVELTLALDPDTEIAPTVEAVNQSVADGLASKFAVPMVGRPKVHVRYEELRIQRPGQRGPAQPEGEPQGAPAGQEGVRAQDLPTQVVTIDTGDEEDARPDDRQE